MDESDLSVDAAKAGWNKAFCQNLLNNKLICCRGDLLLRSNHSQCSLRLGQRDCCFGCDGFECLISRDGFVMGGNKNNTKDEHVSHEHSGNLQSQKNDVTTRRRREHTSLKLLQANPTIYLLCTWSRRMLTPTYVGPPLQRARWWCLSAAVCGLLPCEFSCRCRTFIFFSQATRIASAYHCVLSQFSPNKRNSALKF